MNMETSSTNSLFSAEAKPAKTNLIKVLSAIQTLRKMTPLKTSSLFQTKIFMKNPISKIITKAMLKLGGMNPGRIKLLDI